MYNYKDPVIKQAAFVHTLTWGPMFLRHVD